ncbi:MAG: tetratricopeptide repeat protein [Anaerolineales bacterium]|nr:tetratricopeptide repeat protein [Anaerolineales bacterium]
MKRNQTKPDQLMLDFNDFGSFLKYLRLRAELGQRDLGLAVGYGEAQISRLEHNHRLPDLEMVRARFIPALGLGEQPELAKRLVELALLSLKADDAGDVQVDEMGALEAVPPKTGSEIIRQPVMDAIQDAFRESHAVLLFGFPGIGKSTLCGAIMRRVHESKRPVFWHTVSRSDPSPVETLVRQLALFLVSQGADDAALLIQPGALPLEAGMQFIAERLREVRPFICVDEFHHIQARLPSLAPIETLIRNSGCKFLLASRERSAIEGAVSVALTGMNVEESRACLSARGLTLPYETMRSLYEITLGNPMLLTLAGAELLRNPSQAKTYMEKLAAQREIASYLTESALADLPDPALNLLSLVSVVRQPINLLDVELAERLRKEELTPMLSDVLALLQRRHFIENSAEARLHPLLQEHLEMFLRAKPELHRKIHLLVARHLRALTPHSIEALYHFAQAANAAEMIDLIQNSILRWDSTGQGEAAADLIADLLKRARGSENLAPENEAQLLSQRGQLLMSGRRAGEAEADFRQAFAIALKTDSPRKESVSIALKLARYLLQRGKVFEADQLCDDAEGGLASTPDSSLLAEILAVRCTVRLMQTRLDEASEIASRALVLAEPLAHREVRLTSGVWTMCHNTLGILSHIRRDIPAALSHWRKAEEAALLAGNLRTVFRIKGNIGGLHFDQGELNEARETYEGILDAAQSAGDVFTLGKILNALGAIYYLQARSAEALEMLDRAKRLKQLIGDLQGEATTENQRAQVLLSSGRAGEALQIMERLLKQTEETGEMRWRASYLDTVGMIRLAQGEFRSARERLQEAMSLPGASSDPQLKTYLRNHLSLAELGAGDAELALKTYSERGGMLESGMVEVESRFVAALLSNEEITTLILKLSQVEVEAKQRATHLFSNMARQARIALESGKQIPESISAAIGSSGIVHATLS